MEKTAKKIKIIDTAEKIFANKGFHGTSIKDIADGAKVNAAMIFYYFGSKEKLLQAIFEERSYITRTSLQKIVSDKILEPWDKVYRLIDDFIETISLHPEFYKIMISEQILEKNLFINKIINDLKKKNTTLFEAIILSGQQKQVFRKNVDVVMIMNTLFGTIMQSLINKDFYPNEHSQKSFSEEEMQQNRKRKLSKYLKLLFKAILKYEE